MGTPTVLTDYERGDIVGHGLIGIRFEGRYLPTNHAVWLERIPPDLLDRPGFADRIAARGLIMAGLRSPNLVSAYDVVADGRELYLVTQPPPAVRLDDLTRDAWDGHLGVRAVVAILVDVLGAVTLIHDRGASHGGITATSIWVAANGIGVLGDLVSSVDFDASAAPDNSADLVAVATVGCRLLGSRPGTKAKLRGVPHAVAEALRRGLASEPAARYPTSSAFQAALLGAAEATWGLEWRGSAEMPIRLHHRRWWSPVVGVVIVAAVVGVAIALIAAGSIHSATSGTGPLAVGNDVRLTVSPARGGCATTFVMDARGSLHGAGLMVYQWERSDGRATAAVSLPITSDEGSFDLTQSWRFEGSQQVDGAMTFRVLKPVLRTVRQPFTYSCAPKP